jgi:hypothetical protein
MCGGRLIAITGHDGIFSTVQNVNGNLEPLRLGDRPTETRVKTRGALQTTHIEVSLS